jgi:NAD-dependent SIR2 family protein deacetylase
MTNTFVDGSAAAGPLSDVFAFDVSLANGQCVSCGRVERIAQAHVYTQAPGLIVRCASCESVLMRVVTGGGRVWLDFTGLAYLEVAG